MNKMRIRKIRTPRQFNDDELLNIKGGIQSSFNWDEMGCTSCNCYFGNENKKTKDTTTKDKPN